MMLQIMKEPDHWKYAGTAVFFAFIAWRIMRWVWRTSKEVQEEPVSELSDIMEAERLRALEKKRSGVE
jgi:hypothetical protein